MRLAKSKRTKGAIKQATRMAVYRKRARRAGRRRFEVNLPVPDAELIRHAVDKIREGGTEAERMRAMLERSKNPRAKIAKSGKELYELFRSSPLVGVELEFERDKSLPRDVDLF